jgi:signal transduction histidine kinase/CheY-like chemotaxis protein
VLASRERERVEVEAGGRWYEVVADPMLGDDGEVTAVVRTVKDVTDRRDTERRMTALLASEQAARAEAEHVNRLKDEFLATLSHELRTPLNAIVGWAQILRQGLSDEATVRRAIEVIGRNARVQEQLISDILDVSRIVAGKLRLEPRPMDLAEVVAHAMETVRPAAVAKDVALEAHLDGPVPIVGDPARLQQVVLNLLSNAIKFTPRGGHARLRLEADGAAARITVTDDGAGIDAGFLPHVFERFRQADASSTRRHGGLGLGLAIVRHLVELHGGSVLARNAEGAGAQFEVTLPLRAPAPGDAVLLPAVADHPGAQEATPSLAGTIVLVVDDDVDARALIAFVLQRAGARVLVANSAASALELLERERPHVLLADIEMPGQDGYTLIRRVRALDPSAGGAIPAAALTAYAGAHDRVRALQAGFQMHLAKPVDPAELAIVVAGLTQTVAG